MVTVFILCAGSGDRWCNYLGVPKQLLSFGGETLVDRTARLVQERDQRRTYCVTRDSRVFSSRCEHLFVNPTESILATVLATRRYWGARNVFLLGDVFYSRRAMGAILGCRRALVFWGRPWPSALVQCGHGEIFGLSFEAAAERQVCDLVARGLSIASSASQTNLWNLYQLAGGLPLGSSRYLPNLLVPIDDYTNDIDTATDYQRRRRLYDCISTGSEPSLAVSFRSLVSRPKHWYGRLQWQFVNQSVRRKVEVTI
jgi:hypothetical protein